jgi:hypothetical protein
MTSGRIPLWASYNPIHLVPVAYQELAEAVTEGNPDKVSETGSKTSAIITDSRKRDRCHRYPLLNEEGSLEAFTGWLATGMS